MHLLLCRFSVPIGKYFLKITQHYSPRCLDTEGSASPPVNVAVIPASMWGYCLDFREKLIRAIAPGLETKSAANFFHKRLRHRIISQIGNKVLSRNRSQINEDQNLLLERQEALTQIAAELRGIA